MAPWAQKDPTSRVVPEPSVLSALMPLLVLLLILVALLETEGNGSATGQGVLAALLLAATVAGLQARLRGITWQALQTHAAGKLAAIFPVLLILLSIGLLLGTWLAAGTIPMMVWLGLKLVAPQHMAVTAFMATALMSLATGTSWGSAATVGVALIGVAEAHGAPLSVIAGAIVSGAYFGDKLSPLSDTTNVSALAAGTNLHRHIAAMLQTSLPATALAMMAYAYADSQYSGTSSATPEALRQAIEGLFVPHWLPCLPLALVAIAVYRRWPPVPTLMSSAALAALLAHLCQGVSWRHLGEAAISGFRLDMLPAAHGVPDPLVGKLLERGGLEAMATPIPMIIAAFMLTAGLEQSGALPRLLRTLHHIVRSSLGLIVATLMAGGLMIAVTSHGGVSALVVGDTFRSSYRRYGLAPENLSRGLEESITVVEPLLPWTVSALYMATTLGVATFEYAPWAVFAWTSPLLSWALAVADRIFGRGLRRLPTP